MAVIVVEEEPVLSRVDHRLDRLLKQLEEIRSLGRSTGSSSGLSTPSSRAHSDDTSPRSTGEHYFHPISRVIMEAEVKGTLVDRLDLLESRIVKMEEELETEKRGASGNRKPQKKKKRWFAKLREGGARNGPASHT
ncbi:hypothetical protein MLD38_008890 [Melastoma candidum]|uniref:Uncharacterized protein n=1 Tax=Melastoma candidum TaxID=119954 RepID=A0ACB9RW01_9MYRT|nr:hypothetical protein MLD38_008890 [Melastoma candidum]